MHSPFVFNFILNVLNNKSGYTPQPEIEELRKKLLSDKKLIEIEDLGAGSRSGTTQKKSVAHIAKSALKSKKYAQMLYRLARHYQPQSIVELGTSLGLTAAYFSEACPAADITTIEGSRSIFSLARENLAGLCCENVESVHGNFDVVLRDVLAKHKSVDLAYIDGNHRYEPTMNYFSQFLKKSHSGTILVFDDIHWSEEMEKAWKEIKEHPSVQYTIDIFFLGFVFFREEFKVRQHFVVRF